MDTPIRMPFLERRRDNLHIQKPVQPNAAIPFRARSFVKIGAGGLVPCLTDDTVCYGYCVDASHTATEQPPTALFGVNHWPFDPKDCLFVMNVTDGAGKIGQAAGAPQLSGAVVGTAYALYAGDPVTGYQMLNLNPAATNKILKVVALYPYQALTDYNGLVIVEFVPSALQG